MRSTLFTRDGLYTLFGLEDRSRMVRFPVSRRVEIVGWPNLDDDHKCSIVQTRGM